MPSAIAVFDGPRIKGDVTFIEGKVWTTVTLNLSGLKKNSKRDISKGCESMCAHFNPFNKNHGGPKSSDRHVGDLGNIKSDENGYAMYSFRDGMIKLHGKANIVGRGLIIHADPDDLGTGNHELSLTTGNSGKRIACAVIGIKNL
jgi:Cu-Zn family superoxide dismutase